MNDLEEKEFYSLLSKHEFNEDVLLITSKILLLTEDVVNFTNKINTKYKNNLTETGYKQLKDLQNITELLSKAQVLLQVTNRLIDEFVKG